MSTPPGKGRQPAQPFAPARQAQAPAPSQSQLTGPKDIQLSTPLVQLGEGSADSQSLARRARSAQTGGILLAAAPELGITQSLAAAPTLMGSPTLMGTDRGSLNASPMLTASALRPHLEGSAPLSAAHDPKATAAATQHLQSGLSQPGVGLSPEVANPLQQAAASADQPTGSLGLVEQPAVAPQRWLRTPVKAQQVRSGQMMRLDVGHQLGCHQHRACWAKSTWVISTHFRLDGCSEQEARAQLVIWVVARANHALDQLLLTPH